MNLNRNFSASENYSFQYPIISGYDSITGFTDVTQNETVDKFFQKTFRYSLDAGLNWTDQIPLTNPNLALITFVKREDLVIELTYSRVGLDLSGIIILDSIVLTTTATLLDPLGVDFWDQSPFKGLILEQTDPLILEWSQNVLRKLFQKGYIIPDYIQRSRNESGEDKDFIDFWRAVTRYFAYIVILGRKFESFYENEFLLREYLIQRGLFLCPEQSLSDMQYLMENFWDEIRQRGTFMISKPKGELINGVPKPIDGELLRLICYNPECDEFLFNFTEFHRLGWTVDQWSGLWMGVGDQRQLCKLWETTPDAQSLSNYPNIDPNTNLAVVSEGAKMVIRIDGVLPGTEAGVGPGIIPDFDFSTNVSPGLHYELTFFVKAADITATITAGLYAFDIALNPVDLESTQSALFPVKVTFFDQITFPIGTDYYFVKCLLFPSGQPFIAASEFTTPNILLGNNLRMTPDVCKIIPYIVVENSGGTTLGPVYLWDIRFQLSRTQYSTGFVEGRGLLQLWLKYNTGQFTNLQLEEVIRFYLIELESLLYVTYI